MVENNNLLLIFLCGLSLVLLFAVSIALLVARQKQKQAALRLVSQELEFRHQEELIRHRVEVQEQSMNLVCDEIHDSVGQLLIVALGYQQRLLKMVDSGQSRDLLTNSIEMMLKIINEVRTISHSLNSDLVNEMGMVKAVGRLMGALSDLGMITEFNVEGGVKDLTKEQDLLIYRIVQEATQNILKHSEATECGVTLDFQPEVVGLRIEDNGKGFDSALVETGNHSGLMSVRSRATLLNATLSIDSSPGSGCHIHLSIPV